MELAVRQRVKIYKIRMKQSESARGFSNIYPIGGVLLAVRNPTKFDLE